jgi:hypothetical protein
LELERVGLFSVVLALGVDERGIGCAGYHLTQWEEVYG